MGLAKRQNLDNGIAQSEIHRSYYAYTISVDLDRVGIDGEINVSKEEKAKRVKHFLKPFSIFIEIYAAGERIYLHYLS